MTEPRDQLVDPQHWADVEAIHQRNLEYCLRRIRDGVEGAEDRYGEVRLYGWLSRYSRGDELDGLVEEVPDLISDWLPVISDGNLFKFSFTIGALAHLVRRHDLLVGTNPSLTSHATKDRLAGWIFGDAEALDSDNYTDPPKSGGIIDKRVALARLAAANPTDATSALETFVRQDWYPGSKGAGWWGAHAGRSGPRPTYTGYWCWEAAAIAHICGVDDDPLNGQKYYPYDLVHYLDQA